MSKQTDALEGSAKIIKFLRGAVEDMLQNGGGMANELHPLLTELRNQTDMYLQAVDALRAEVRKEIHH